VALSLAYALRPRGGCNLGDKYQGQPYLRCRFSRSLTRASNWGEMIGLSNSKKGFMIS
jgi:hypothetical protein